MKNPPHRGAIIGEDMLGEPGLTVADAAARLGISRHSQPCHPRSCRRRPEPRGAARACRPRHRACVAGAAGKLRPRPRARWQGARRATTRRCLNRPSDRSSARRSCPHPAHIRNGFSTNEADRGHTSKGSNPRNSAGVGLKRTEKDRTSLGSNPTVTASLEAPETPVIPRNSGAFSLLGIVPWQRNGNN